MIVVVGGIKGGTGKTTIATNLAVLRAQEGQKVLLVDADEQRSASDWADQRETEHTETSWTTVLLAGKSLRTQVLKMKDNYDNVIIDVGGRETTSLRAAISVADILIIPFKPRSLDIWTLGDVKTLLEEMASANPTLKAFSLVNQADAKGTDNKEALSILGECKEIKCIPITIGARKAFANASSEGKGVTEMKLIDKKAVEEIHRLDYFIYTENTCCV